MVAGGEHDRDNAKAAPKLTKNQRTMLAGLHAATEQWNEGARQAGLGVTRKADLFDFRAALKSKGLVRQYGDHWMVAA